MSSDITVHSSSYQVDNRAWLIGTHGVDITPGITLDISKFNPANVNEVQTVTISATGGTFTLTCSGQTTTAIAWNAAATAVQSALEALSNIAVGDVSVAGANGGPYTVTFGGALGNQNVAALTGSGASLTGGAGTVTIATTTAGVTGHYVNGYIPSGFPLGKITATGLYGPYDDTANDGRQTCKGLRSEERRVGKECRL